MIMLIMIESINFQLYSRLSIVEENQAKNNKTQLLIKKQDGQIQKERSYGNDSYPPEG